MRAADKCADSKLCTNITGDFWQYLLNDLQDYGQGSADEALTNATVDAANTSFYIVQPDVRRSGTLTRQQLYAAALPCTSHRR